jgi:hypothetical protein
MVLDEAHTAPSGIVTAFADRCHSSWATRVKAAKAVSLPQIVHQQLNILAAGQGHYLWGRFFPSAIYES